MIIMVLIVDISVDHNDENLTVPPINIQLTQQQITSLHQTINPLSTSLINSKTLVGKVVRH